MSATPNTHYTMLVKIPASSRASRSAMHIAFLALFAVAISSILSENIAGRVGQTLLKVVLLFLVLVVGFAVASLFCVLFGSWAICMDSGKLSVAYHLFGLRFSRKDLITSTIMKVRIEEHERAARGKRWLDYSIVADALPKSVVLIVGLNDSQAIRTVEALDRYLSHANA